VVYPGTHDNDTALGWYRSLGKEEKSRVLAYLAGKGIRVADEREIPWALMALAFSSRAGLAVIPIQDILGLGSEARMNYPSRPEGNWTWRLTTEPHSALAKRLFALAQEMNRIP
jgi:4-alpha-glucanotransferase